MRAQAGHPLVIIQGAGRLPYLLQTTDHCPPVLHSLQPAALRITSSLEDECGVRRGSPSKPQHASVARRVGQVGQCLWQPTTSHLDKGGYPSSAVQGFQGSRDVPAVRW